MADILRRHVGRSAGKAIKALETLGCEVTSISVPETYAAAALFATKKFSALLKSRTCSAHRFPMCATPEA